MPAPERQGRRHAPAVVVETESGTEAVRVFEVVFPDGGVAHNVAAVATARIATGNKCGNSGLDCKSRGEQQTGNQTAKHAGLLPQGIRKAR